MSSEFDVALTEPVMVIDTPLSKLTFRRPTGRDMIGLPKLDDDPIGYALTLASRCTKNAPALTLMDMDFAEAMRVSGEFMKQLPPTMRALSSISTSSAPAAGETTSAS